MTRTKADLRAKSGRNELNAKKAFHEGSRSKTDNGLFTKALGAKPITDFSRRLTEQNR